MAHCIMRPMFWDMAIALLLAILAALVSGLAGHLAATEAWHKWFFWGSGVLMVALIGIQTYRNAMNQRDLENKLSAIQKNTESPPVVNIAPPAVTVEVPRNKPKSYVDFDHIELNWDKSSSQLFVNAYATNKAAEVAQNVNARFGVGFVHAVNGLPSREQEDKAFADWEKQSKSPNTSTTFVGALGPGQQIFGTMTVTGFDQHFLDRLNSGEGGVMIVVGQISFADDNGTHHKDWCQFVQPPLLFAPESSHIVTHFCESHNNLRY